MLFTLFIFSSSHLTLPAHIELSGQQTGLGQRSVLTRAVEQKPLRLRGSAKWRERACFDWRKMAEIPTP
jgi:hypothetical protein